MGARHLRSLVPIAIAFLACIMTGCSHVNRVDPTRDGNSLSGLNRSLQGKTVTVELRDGGKRKGDGVNVRADSTFWYEDKAVVSRTSVPTSAIAKISYRERGRSIWRCVKYGLIGGGVAGSLVGALLGAAIDESAGGALGGAILIGGIGAAYGAGTGVVLGLLFAPEESYVFTERGALRQDE